jgi:hypothetical protein
MEGNTQAAKQVDLADVREELARLNAKATVLLDLAKALGDALDGGRPEKEPCSEARQPQSSLVAQLADLVYDLDARLGAIAGQINRAIERTGINPAPPASQAGGPRLARG